MRLSRFLGITLAVLAVAAARPAIAATAHPVSARDRAELLAAREAAWRAFYDPDTTALERVLGPELIAIQESDADWPDRGQLVALARRLKELDVRLIRLEFPRTEIQRYGDTAILYYTYIFETGVHGVSGGVDAGRGTEIFVRRGGRWVDVGWHLDNGPFFQKDGRWVKNGPHPAPSTAPPAGSKG
jgi:hypothetical protein